MNKVFFLIIFYLISESLAQSSTSFNCNNTESTVAPQIQFCAGSGFDSTSFVADAEVRTFRGNDYMSFSGVALGAAQLRLWFARKIGNCWGEIKPATFDDQTLGNEVSSFLIEPDNTILLYYNHYIVSAGYDTETFSLRLTVGLISDNGSVIGFAPANLNFGTSGFNTFVLWANSKSPDLLYAVNSNWTDINCYPPTEPSVFKENDTYYLSLGCFNFVDYTFQIKLISAKNGVFVNHTAPKTLLTKDSWCPTKYPLGFQAGTIIRMNNRFYLAASPLRNSTSIYEGCLIFEFQSNLNSSLTGPIAEISLGFPHSGSCTGGSGSLTETELSNDITYFHTSDPVHKPYKLVRIPFPTSTTTTTTTSGMVATSTTTSDVVSTTGDSSNGNAKVWSGLVMVVALACLMM